MYAVFRTGGKQYRVETGQELLVEQLRGVEPGQSVPFSDVLLYCDGNDLSVGRPRVPVTIHCLCVGHEKGPKIRTFKYKKRKSHKKTIGHRQTLTRLRVERFERTAN